MTGGLSGLRAGGWPLLAGLGCGVLVGRFMAVRHGRRPGPPAATPARPDQGARRRPPVRPAAEAVSGPQAAQGTGADLGAGLLAGDDELLRLADREDAWW